MSADLSQGDSVAKAMRIVEDPRTPVLDRVGLAIYVAAGGDETKLLDVSHSDVAELLPDLSVADVRQALAALAE